MSNLEKADVCLLLEGTFPYISGGVSSWIYDLILNHPDLTFSILCIIPPSQKLEYKYNIPDNVLSVNNLILYDIPKGRKIYRNSKKTFISDQLIQLLEKIVKDRNFESYKNLLEFTNSNKDSIGKTTLFNSDISWNILREMYEDIMPKSSFFNFFWSWRALFGGLFTVLLADLPDADCYHSLCTGYAGLLLAKAKLEKNKSCFLTEHGIYTNERRIEIATAQWLFDNRQYDLSIHNTDNDGLQQLWSSTFSNYSFFCYSVCEYIITLFEGNRKLQILDGAPQGITRIIPNGIDFKRFSKISRISHKAPTIALIGRVVPIKDIKTYIKSVSIVKKHIPEIKAYIMGPTDEDEDYYKECVSLVNYEELNENIEFTGKVNIDDYLGEVDLIVLTSLSEAQPLVILECGAAGIPTVATNVGSCHEIIFGKTDEQPNLGRGGSITPLTNPKATAAEIVQMLQNFKLYSECSKNIQKRVEKYYKKEDQHKTYSDLYKELIKKSEENRS